MSRPPARAFERSGPDMRGLSLELLERRRSHARLAFVPARLAFVPVLLALVAVHAGCTPCRDWADLPVIDPDGLATTEHLSSVQKGIDQFVGWTQRTETCVAEVGLVEEIVIDDHAFAGVYRSATREIEVRVGGGMAGIATHELCHALDHEEGVVSVDHADVLAPYAALVDEALYDTPDARTREAFARICAEGPYLPAFYRRVSAACGSDVSDAAVDFVAGVAFPDAEDDTALGTFAATASWAEIASTERTGDPLGVVYAPGGADLYVLDHAGVSDEAGLEYAIAPELLRIDPATREVRERLPLEPYAPTRLEGQPTTTLHSLIGSSGAPILYSALDGAAWRVHGDPLALEPIDLPAFDAETFVWGFEHDGRVLVEGKLGGERAIAVVDLDAGTTTPVAGGEVDRFRADQPDDLYADALGGVGVFWGGAGLVVVGLDWAGEVEWAHALPAGVGRLHGLARLPDGTILLVPVLSPTDGDGMGVGLPLPLRLDPVAGTWSAPSSGCEGWLAQESWMVAGERSVLVRTQDNEDGTYTLRWGEMTVSD